MTNRKLTTHVHVYDEHGFAHRFGPDDDVPEWAAAQIGDHCYADDQPARAGKGSSREAWAAFAVAHGLEVTDDESRDDLIAKCEQAGLVQ